jgi:hypothetical protein
MARSKATYEYDVTMPILPAGATSPVMDHQQMTDWLNQRAAHRWEFVSHGQTNWADGTIQDWWIFRRLTR